ncbi:hypothetical protein B0T22DRAFT_123314 [Podospora appendiculata]|uniref:J domain-containing protein n=1 Tax=Podospora appendiculata TaxID=314037 RepID=A0AAE0X753_9PEZI|nr:hypothetical protein B0T22DRAFT_123314 [Podospora appendiculata]
MVKLDCDRDYYADLDLPPLAETTEVKKQFKKLALRWHPDRNPGKEDESKDRFLIIQSAHEILTDPASKAKYDAYRKRMAGHTTASGFRGNPYSNVSENVNSRFGAPPTRRPPMPTRPSAPSTGSRYDTWGMPPPGGKAKPDPSENMRAWERMRPTRDNQGRTQMPPTTPKPRAPTAANPPPPPPPTPPRTASQARRADAAFGTRRAAAPTTPLSDEAASKTNSYYSSNLRKNIFAEATKNAEKPRPASDFVDPMTAQFSEANLDNRQRTPYASNVGEKTNPFEGASINRAKSVKESWHRFRDAGGETPPPGPQRQRSASVGEDGFKKTPAASNQNGGLNGSNGNSGAQSRAGTRYSSRGAEPNAAPSHAAFPGPNSSNSSVDSSAHATVNGGAPPKAKGGPTVYATFLKFPADQFHTHSNPYIQPNPTTPHSNGRAGEEGNYSRPAFTCPAESSVYGGRTTPSGGRSPTRNLNSFDRGIHAQLQHLLSKLKKPSQKQPPSRRDAPLSPKKSSHRVVKRTNAPHPTSFTVPDDDDEFETMSPNTHARFMRNSADNINTRFVADEKAGESYQFNAGGESSPDDAFTKAKQRSRSAPRGRQSPLRPGFKTSAESFTIPPETFTTHQEKPVAEEKSEKPSAFDPQAWADQFGPYHFVPPPVSRQATSPTRTARPTKKPKSVRMTAGTAVLVDDEDTSSEERTHVGEDMDGARSPNAMDIDTPPSESPAGLHPASARNINVEPSKPEWRAGDVNGSKQDSTPSKGPKMPAPTAKSAANPNAAGSEDQPEFNVKPMLAELRNVEKPSGTNSLNSFGDLKSSLPFESKASARLPLEREKARTLDFPRVPTAPTPPAVLAIPNLRPNATSWTNYVAKFAAYQVDWEAFNKQIVDHFVARQRKCEVDRSKGVDWVGAVGDAGISETLRACEEDRIVRQKWMAACDAHELQVREFMKHRLRMKA